MNNLLHQSSVQLINAIATKSEFNLSYFSKLYDVEWHPSLEATLYKLHPILQSEFEVFEIIGKKQMMSTYTLYRVLCHLFDNHFHALENTKSAHEESLASHLVGAMLISTNDALNKHHSNSVLVALCALFHDIGKISTIQKAGNPKYPMTAFYFHAEMGSGIMQLCYSDTPFISFEEWQYMCTTINYHMCTYHSHTLDLKQINQIAIKQLLPMSVRHLLYHLSVGDMSSRLPIPNIQAWLPSRELLLLDHSQESIEYFNKFTNNGILIQLMGISASGKSTLYAYIKEKFKVMQFKDDDIQYIQRDDYICKEACLFANLPLPTSTPTGKEYKQYHDIYKSNKLSGAVNSAMKNDIQLGLISNKIVIIDTVAVLFQAYRDIIPEVANLAFKVNIYIIRNKMLTNKDADRLGLTLQEQVLLHGDRSLLNWMPSDFNKKAQSLYKRRQMMGSFYNSAGVTKAMINKESPLLDFVVCWGNEQSLLEPMFKIVKQISTSTVKCESLYDFELDLTQLIDKLEGAFGFDFLVEFFKGLNILVAQPFKDHINLSKKCIIVKYKENCQFWKAKWARQARGGCFVKFEKNWICIKSLLQRGCEVLTGIHMSNDITDSQDYHIGKIAHFDENQQNVILKFVNQQEIDGILSSKIDGSLLGISLIPLDHKIAPFVVTMIKTFNIPSQLAILNYAINNCKFIPMFSSQGTMLFGEFMEDWYFSAYLVGLAIVDQAQLKKYKNENKSVLQVVELHVKDICDQLQLFIDLNVGFIKNDMCCLSFETICPNRQSEWGIVHTELALSYPKYICKVLGCQFGMGSTMGRFIPHLDIKLPVHWQQPMVWQIKHTSQVVNMVADVENVIHSKLKINEFYNKYPPLGELDDFLDFEGFVFYNINGDSVDYSKIKTLVYYHAHNPNKKTIDGLLKIQDDMAAHIPSVLMLKSYFNSVDKGLMAVKDALYSELLHQDASYIEEMSSKAQNSYLKQPLEVKMKMIINNSKRFLNTVKEEFALHFDGIKHVKQQFLKVIIMKMAIWQQDGELLRDLIKTEDQMLFDLYIEIMNSEEEQENAEK